MQPDGRQPGRLFYAELLGHKESRSLAAHSIGEHEEQRSELKELAAIDFEVRVPR